MADYETLKVMLRERVDALCTALEDAIETLVCIEATGMLPEEHESNWLDSGIGNEVGNNDDSSNSGNNDNFGRIAALVSEIQSARMDDYRNASDAREKSSERQENTDQSYSESRYENRSEEEEEDDLITVRDVREIISCREASLDEIRQTRWQILQGER